jgi:hypothetical protein
VAGLTYYDDHQQDVQRDASLVTYTEDGPWTDKADPAEHVTRILLRNLSTLTVTGVVLQAGGDSYQPQVQVNVIPPCREMTVWVRRDQLQLAWQRMDRSMDLTDVPLWRTARMDFSVAGASWERTNDRLAPRPARAHDTWPAAGLTAARIVKTVEARAIPCGTGG